MRSSGPSSSGGPTTCAPEPAATTDRRCHGSPPPIRRRSTEAQRRVYEATRAGRRGTVPANVLAWLPSPELAQRAQHLGAFLRYDTSLGPRLTELAILVVARRWSSGYEWAHPRRRSRQGRCGPSVDCRRSAPAGGPTLAGRRRAGRRSTSRRSWSRTAALADATFARAEAALGRQGAGRAGRRGGLLHDGGDDAERVRGRRRPTGAPRLPRRVRREPSARLPQRRLHPGDRHLDLAELAPAPARPRRWSAPSASG